MGVPLAAVHRCGTVRALHEIDRVVAVALVYVGFARRDYLVIGCLEAPAPSAGLVFFKVHCLPPFWRSFRRQPQRAPHILGLQVYVNHNL